MASDGLEIRRLNDKFRTTLEGGRVVFTGVLAALDAETLMLQHLVLASVRLQKDFEPGNDPYGEHDFGKVTVKGEDYFWKIDYYDLEMENGSEDPADPSQTTRVMTICHSMDY